MILPKVEIKKILYATDLSEGARQAFAYVIDLANNYNAAITILHVLPGSGDLDVEPLIVRYIGKENWLKIKKRNYNDVRSVLINKQKERNAIQEVLYQFSESHKDEAKSQHSVTDEIIIEESQDPVDVILKKTETKNCDLIVMGMRGHGAIAETLIGSTARRVIRHSQKPVFVVPLQ